MNEIAATLVGALALATDGLSAAPVTGEATEFRTETGLIKQQNEVGQPWKLPRRKPSITVTSWLRKPIDDCA